MNAGMVSAVVGVLAEVSAEQQARAKMMFRIIAIVGGMLGIATGVMFIRRREADVTGKRALTALRGSSKFEGDSAVKLGMTRVVVGAVFVVMGLLALTR